MESALWIATQNGNVDVYTLLLENDAHVNQQRNNGEIALCRAEVNRYVDTCTQLLKNNTHVNQQDHEMLIVNVNSKC